MASETHTIREENGYRLVGRKQDDRRTVVRVGDHQVFDAMPCDGPGDGGSYFAPDCDDGVDYVACWYSRDYATRMYRRLTKDASKSMEISDWDAIDAYRKQFANAEDY